MTAVAPVVVDCGGKWVGWAGDCSLSAEDEIPEASEEDTTPTAGLLKHQVSSSIIRETFLAELTFCYR